MEHSPERGRRIGKRRQGRIAALLLPQTQVKPGAAARQAPVVDKHGTPPSRLMLSVDEPTLPIPSTQGFADFLQQRIRRLVADDGPDGADMPGIRLFPAQPRLETMIDLASVVQADEEPCSCDINVRESTFRQRLQSVPKGRDSHQPFRDGGNIHAVIDKPETRGRVCLRLSCRFRPGDAHMSNSPSVHSDRELAYAEG